VKTKNPADERGSTPLSEACKNDHFDICRLIINQRENAFKDYPQEGIQNICFFVFIVVVVVFGIVLHFNF
jgi:ankyrin repeat protein